MNFGIKVKNLDRNWEAETGTVATTDLEKFPRSQLVAKNYEIYWYELLVVMKISVMESNHFE